VASAIHYALGTINNMKPLILFTFVSITLASITADAQTDTVPVGSESAAAKEIRGWLDRWTKAFTSQDLDSIMALYTDDVIAFDVVPPLQYRGKAEYRTDYQQFLSQYDSNLKVEVRDLNVGAMGDLGYATGLELISGTLKGGKKSAVWLRFTSLFRKSNGHWLDFHDHVSVPADIETGKAMLDLKP
jgi:ketosteroid isomerase-like protein